MTVKLNKSKLGLQIWIENSHLEECLIKINQHTEYLMVPNSIQTFVACDRTNIYKTHEGSTGEEIIANTPECKDFLFLLETEYSTILVKAPVSH
jgi:hypothetical protein